MMIIVDQSKQNPSEIQPSEITSQSVYSNRRHFIKLAASSGLITSAALLSLKAKAANIAGSGSTSRTTLSARTNTPQSTKSLKKDAIYNPRQKLEGVIKSEYGRELKIDTYDNITTYNNYYEFGTDKSNPVVQARTFQPNPWTISIEGEVKKPKTMSIEALMKLTTLQERIYRMRCVEGWSMVIPWVGLPLASLIKWAEPTGNAKYVEFVTANDPDSMPGVNAPILDWPYTEGLRIDEAMHPLALIAVGLYGELLPNQNGAPARLVVPWKYGFKGGKSIVKIRFVEKMPQTTWMQAGPTEYGFFANVNPKASHPRWSQSTERPIGGGLFGGRIKTKMFNGYESEVGQLYAGMDLRKYF